MAMSAAERKKLIAKGKENARIAEAIAEEKRILASKPVHRMTPDERLKSLPKTEAVKIIDEKRERMAAGIALMSGKSEKTEKKPKKPEKTK